MVRYSLLRGLACLTLVVGATSACGSGPPPDSGPSPETSSQAPSAPPPPKIPTDCAGSSVALQPAPTPPGVSLELSTDPTGSSLLVRNTGDLTVLMAAGDQSTLLLTAPHANTTDAASIAALNAVANDGVTRTVDGAAPGAVFVVPPQFAVCALSSAGGPPAVRYQQDRAASASYVVAKSLHERLDALAVPPGQRRAASLIACARTAEDLTALTEPGDDAALYASLLSGGSSCRQAYRQLFVAEAQASRFERTLLTTLNEAPFLRSTSKVLTAIVK